MNDNNRRTFLKETGLGLAAVAATGTAARAAGANERIVVGVIGPGGMVASQIEKKSEE